MSNLALDNIRKNVIYQNSIDIWIATCQEKNIDWNDTKKYQTFIGYLLKSGLNMKKFPLCIKESGEILIEVRKRQNLVMHFQN